MPRRLASVMAAWNGLAYISMSRRATLVPAPWIRPSGWREPTKCLATASVRRPASSVCCRPQVSAGPSAATNVGSSP
jgi:hypothetical protein